MRMSPDPKSLVRAASASALLATLLLSACARPAPPVPPAPPVATIAPVERPIVSPKPVPPPRPVDLRWAFTTGADLCTAIASGPGGSLQVQTGASRQIVLVARFTAAGRPAQRARPAKLSFSGAAGNWSVPGTWQDASFTSTRPLDERGVASVLGLLGGGNASVTAGPLRVGSARLPPAGNDGNAWVQCPKQMMAP